MRWEPFLAEVMEQVTGLFPGRYVHIGGDEVPQDRWTECPRCQVTAQAVSQFLLLIVRCTLPFSMLAPSLEGLDQYK